jgi:hypothetical protein
LENFFLEGGKQPELLPENADEAQFPELAGAKQLVAAETSFTAFGMYLPALQLHLNFSSFLYSTNACFRVTTQTAQVV